MTLLCSLPPPPGTGRQGELLESLHPAQRYLTRQGGGGWRRRRRRGPALQRQRLSRGCPGHPGETQGQPGRCGRHTEAAQDGGADQERARRSVAEAQMWYRPLFTFFPSFYLSFFLWTLHPAVLSFHINPTLSPALLWSRRHSIERRAFVSFVFFVYFPALRQTALAVLAYSSAMLCIFITTWQ